MLLKEKDLLQVFWCECIIDENKVKEAFAAANASLHKGDGRNVHVQTKGCMFDM
ncbi:hypothetical protein [Ureibacillus sp. FSL W8-0352]|jgi:hypothetical protein|uniref:hypothetical protein n=1 Tax=Ureibacillus sp. FSL W8-0352 TaxID=2954596 RepID=UPI00031A3B5D